jgi:hypothetical protein
MGVVYRHWISSTAGRDQIHQRNDYDSPNDAAAWALVYPQSIKLIAESIKVTGSSGAPPVRLPGEFQT